MKILLTGATGFVGKAIFCDLSERDHELFLTARSNSFPKELVNSGHLFSIDLSNSEALNELEKIGNLDVVIHAAGLAHQFENTPEEEFFNVNVKSTKNLLRMAQKLSAKHFILISSVAVYGNSLYQKVSGTDENTDCQPVGGYAKSKLTAEKVAIEFCRENGMALTILRPVTVIGEEDRGNVMRLIKAIDQNKFRWIGRGENRKSLIDKKDLARSCRYVLENKTGGIEILNVSGEALSMNEIVTIISSITGNKIGKVYVPDRPLKVILRIITRIGGGRRIRSLLETIEKWTADDVYSSQKIADVYGYRPKTIVAEALRREIAFYIKSK